ncbi:MAG: glycosyltransferase [Actinobacteria bacterium]|nr:glycosyltransferase [Actinomycetota bacterium]
MNYINIIIHAVFWLFGFFILWKIPKCNESTIDGKKSNLSISVIIPARNEEKNLDNLFNSLNNQTVKVKEIILVDDSSTDKTPVIGRKHNAKVISLKSLPKGWVGKSWACYNGAKNSTGDYFIFLDADTALKNNGIENILSCLKRYQGVISLQPYHKIKKIYENLSLFFNIISLAGMGAFTPFQTRINPIGAFGPCLICKREDYFKIDGHKSIKGKVMEDIEIGKRFIEAKIPVVCLGGKGTIDFRMYPGGFMEMIRGWSKSFGNGARSTSIPILIMVIAWIVGSIFPLNLLADGLSPFIPNIILVAAVFYLAFIAQIYWMSYRIGNFSIWAIVFYPIPLTFFVIVFFYSLIITIFRKRVTWKDRVIKT